jgi:hypothetical protein
MVKFQKWVYLTVLGWALFGIFGLLALAINGSRELVSAMVFVVVAMAMGAWVVARRSRPALIVSLVLGLLHTLEQVAYLVADIGAKHVDGAAVAADALGLVAGLLIVVGSVLALAARRTALIAQPDPVAVR